jgi:hypothetical protein
MSFIFVFGPCWNNLQTLINTINNNSSLISNIKRIYISTNDPNTHRFFSELNNPDIISDYFYENQGHQSSCFNSIISGMKLVIANEKDNHDDDIIIFSHEDVFIKDIDLFNNSVRKLKQGYDVVCREYTGSKKGESMDYYMNDAFLIKKNKVKDIFGNSCMKTIGPGNFCEQEFTTIIKDHNVFSIPYWNHSTHKDSELGFYHILNYNIGDISFWDKSNIEDIYNL